MLRTSGVLCGKPKVALVGACEVDQVYATIRHSGSHPCRCSLSLSLTNHVPSTFKLDIHVPLRVMDGHWMGKTIFCGWYGSSTAGEVGSTCRKSSMVPRRTQR